MNEQAPRHPIAAQLVQRGITTIAVMDDASDPPTRADVATTINEFWSEVEDGGLKGTLSELVGKPIEDERDIDDAVVQAIWGGRGTDAVLSPLIETLVAPIDDKRRPLETLRQRLEGELHMSTAWYGNVDQLADTAPQMIFVDYYMRPGHGNEAVLAAKDIVSNIDQLYKEAGFKPVIVLMSSAEVSEGMVEEFRRSSGWLAGLFYFISKDEFRDAKVFFLRLVTFAQSAPAGHQLQALLDAIAESVHGVADRFVEDVKALHLSDYAYLQMMSLQEDGHPLGDYLVWLYGSYIGQLLFGDGKVRERRREIDKLVFGEVPGAQARPSDMLARLYESATVEAVEAELGHPRAAEGAAEPHLHLGDVFVRMGSRKALMIVNAQCDLEFAPGVDSRPFRPDRGIVMIPGKLRPLRETAKNSDRGKPRTEVFRHGDEFFRIVWEPKRVCSVSYGEVGNWLSSRSYELAGRLRLPAALQVQQAFAADLTRVGLPTAPPIQRVATAELYCSGEDGKAVRLATHVDGAYVFATRDGARCVVADEFAIKVDGQLGAAVEHLTKRLAFLEKMGAKKGTLKQIQAWVDAIGGLVGRHDVGVHLRVPFVPRAMGEAGTVPELPISVQVGGAVRGCYRYEQPLLVHVRDV